MSETETNFWDHPEQADNPKRELYKRAERASNDAFFKVVLARFNVTREEYNEAWKAAGEASAAAYSKALEEGTNDDLERRYEAWKAYYSSPSSSR